MCEYCEKETIIFEQNHMGLDGPWTFDSDAKATRKDYEAFEYRQGIYIDTRGYLRMVDMDDCQCLDHGHNLKISFCPMCGRDMRANPAEGPTREGELEAFVRRIAESGPRTGEDARDWQRDAQALARESTGGKA